MIRIVAGLFALTFVVSAAIVFRNDRPPLQPQIEVTRASAPSFPSTTPEADADNLRETAAVLSQLSAAGTTSGTQTADAVRRALVPASAAGRSAAEIRTLVAEATEIGVTLPDQLITPAGVIDLTPYGSAEPRNYTVAPGDSLGSIAQSHYGTPDAYLRIVEANADAFSRSAQIEVGQVLILPR